MRRFFLLASLLFLSYFSFSQKIRFTDTTNKWNVTINYWFYVPDALVEYVGDTLYKGMEYSILADQYYTYMIREDTAENKVYYRDIDPSFSPWDTAEHVAYDYNLLVGDTLIKRSIQGAKFCIVTSMDSVLIQNVYHKVWTFFQNEWPINFTIIEGIGSLLSPFYHFDPTHINAAHRVYCFSTKNSTPPLSKSIGPFNNTTSCTLDVNDKKAEACSIILPNPVAESSLITLNNIRKGQFLIWNQLGQEVHKQNLNERNVLPLGKIIQVPGMYFYRIVDYSSSRERQHKGSFIRE